MTMPDFETFWIVAMALGIGTYLIRLSFIAAMDKLALPEELKKAMRFIPVAVLAAIVAQALEPSFSAACAEATTLDVLAKPLAAVAATLVALRLGSMLAIVGTGMAVLWIIQAI